MKLELFILFIIGVFIYDTYHGGKMMKWIQSLKKYYKTATYIFIVIFIYGLMKSKDPRSKNILYYGYNIIRNLPLEKSYVNSLSPIFDMTNSVGEDYENGNSFMEGLNNINPLMPSNIPSSMNGRGGGGGGYRQHNPIATKRSVSEAKKRYVASSQNWKCANCAQQLNHTFEVDHIMRLEYGGSNEVNNLSALCRNCHGLKTAKENISKSDM